jgi:hypothetical protein
MPVTLQVILHFSLLESRAVPAQKAGIHPTYQTPFQKVVTSPLPTPIAWSKNYFSCFSPGPVAKYSFIIEHAFAFWNLEQY